MLPRKGVQISRIAHHRGLHPLTPALVVHAVHRNLPDTGAALQHPLHLQCRSAEMKSAITLPSTSASCTAASTTSPMTSAARAFHRRRSSSHHTPMSSGVILMDTGIAGNSPASRG